MAIIVRMIMFPLVKPPDLLIVEWVSQRWQADMKINTTERSVRDKPRCVGRELSATAHEPGYGPYRGNPMFVQHAGCQGADRKRLARPNPQRPRPSVNL
jgi:hypothetical protein